NGVAERKNKTLIKAARTMLADSLLPTIFWTEAVNTTCYVQNRVLETKPHNKTPYELLLGRPPSISFMRPFGCPMTILYTLRSPWQIDGRLMRVLVGSGPEWLFDIDSLTKSMNYEPVTAENQTNGDVGIETNVNHGQVGQEKASNHEYILLPLRLSNSPLSSSTQSTDDKDVDEVPDKGDDDKEGYANSTNRDSTASPSVSTAGPSINTASENINTGSPNINTASPIPNDSSMKSLENTGIFDDACDDREVGADADLNNLETTMNVSPIPTTRIHKDHPKDQIIGDINSATQIRRMTKISEEHAMFPDKVYKVEKSYYVYIKLLKPGMRPCLPTYWKIDLEEALLIRLYSSRKTKVISHDAQEIPDEFYGRTLLSSRVGKFEAASKQSNDPPLSRVNTLGSGEDSIKLMELMEHYTKLSELEKVLDLEKAKIAQAKEITSLKKRVKQLEPRRKSRTLGLKRLRKVGSSSRVESSNDVGKAEIEIEKMVEDPVISVVDPVTTAGEVVTIASASVEVPDELTLA
ncbi:retrovirus-related pol polyprotein from transposon TNT 1-94, partial [Tanacetum coccineum]